MSTLKIKRENGKIFCPLADSWHIETPEEKVRQEYIKILVEDYGYSLDQMAQEIKVNNSQRGQGKARADIVIWKSKQDKIESKAAFIVVECKAENVRIREEDYYQGYCGAFGVSRGMLEKFGKDRIMNTPISEQAYVGAGIGAAMAGMRPIVELMFSDFMCVCFDELVNEAPKMRFMFGGKVKVPMVMRTAAGAGTGAAAQHSQSLEACLAHFPGLKVVIPSTPYDAKGLLKTAIRDDNPVMFLEQKTLYRTKGMVPEEEYTIPLGVADVKREGADCSIITYGRMVQMSLQAAEKLAEEGIHVEVVDIRSLVPLDTRTIIESVKKTHRALIVHEAVQFGGFGGEIAGQIADSEAFYYLDAPIRRLGALSCPIPFNPNLERETFPTVDKIIAQVKSLM